MGNENNEKSKISIWGVIRIILIVILIGVICYEGVMVYFDQKEYSIAVNEYDNIRDKYVVSVKEDIKETDEVGNDSRDTGADDGLDEEYYPKLDIDFSALKEVNPDFIGWLYFPAISSINYPVVKEKTINQYLYKTFEGVPNKAGCIFMDVLSDPEFCGMSDMLFGHNMKNGSMFGALKVLYKNKDEDILGDEPYIYIYTEDKVLKYRIFSYYRTTDGSFSYTEVKTEDDYDKYLDYVKKCSMIDIPKDISFDDYPSLLTLSTCAGQHGSGVRFVVHSVKIAAYDK
ncbi:class B sortase [Butyrivibrio sp. VCD2006]|uniref:class B sortase n=1 Tax=Butyrivibrio sp. VCD2006 TaxID=1280664 RepID=UPI000419DCB8|nr:class B sortase [Butyrivibrio sp. VCD2006]